MNGLKTNNGAIALAFDGEKKIATLELQMEGGVNKINATFTEALQEALGWVAKQEGLQGVVVSSAHHAFCVGADIDMLFAERDAVVMRAVVDRLNALYRKLETLGVPVVAALTGTALGGGFELALACHRRIALDDARAQFGLPEVSLGVIPGAGGTQRLPRLIGLQGALQLIAQGKLSRPAQALEAKLVDELCADKQALRAAAEQWIADNPGAKQPWDDKRFRYPPPRPGSPEARDLVLAACGMLYEKTAGAYHAPEAAVQAIFEGAFVNFDRALEVESSAFVKLAVGDQAKDMIRTGWYSKNAAEKHEGLPRVEEDGLRRVGILGAGMMGAALGFVCAQRGFEVVLKDIAQAPLDKAMAHCQTLAQRRLRHASEQERAAVLARITPSLELSALKGCDLVIEAVIEEPKIKHQVLGEIEPLLSEGGIWASNTSALPITELAGPAAHPERFIGLHFFSPVERMPLVEVIMGEKTDEQTLARALSFVGRIKKTPIVVNDGYGFFTTRLFAAYILEGAQMVAEGYAPALVEWAARTAGMAVAPLQVFDEVTLTLVRHAFENGARYLEEHRQMAKLPGFELVSKMVDELGRNGRAVKKGFYDYDEAGKRTGIWPGLMELASKEQLAGDVQTLGRRLLLIQCVEAARCLEAKVLRRPQDADVGALLGLGFAPNTGGPFSYLDRLGLQEAVELLDALEKEQGPRFAPPELLRKMAAAGERFYPA